MQISEGAEVQAGGSGPVNKKQRRSPQHWAHATGYPNSTGPQADPSPAWDKNSEQNVYYFTPGCFFVAQL